MHTKASPAEPIIMSAAGWIKTADSAEFADALRSPLTSITVGSITLKPRDGNPTNKGALFQPMRDGSALNSLGMPNGGAEYYREHLPEMRRRAHDAGKKLRVSVAGFSPEEYANLTVLCRRAGVDEIEHNWGCPNVWGEGGQKPITSFSLEAIERVLDATHTIAGGDTRIEVKLSPYSNPAELEAVAGILGSEDIVSGVVVSNTFPNALDFDYEGKPVIPFGEGLAGYSGHGMRRIALGQVFQFRKTLPIDKSVTGVGGIETGGDLWKFIHCAGASGVQIGTALFKRSVPGASGIVSTMLQEYLDIISK